MKQFIKSLQELTKVIQRNEQLDPSNFDLIKLANLSDEALFQIRSEVEDIELIHCHEFSDLTEEIYKRFMIPTVSKELKAFLKKINSNEMKPVSLIYEFHPWKEFLLETSDSSSRNLILNTAYAEEQIQEFLNHLQIADKSWIEELYDFDYKFNFETEVETVFRELVLECWQEVMQDKTDKVSGTIQEMNGGSHVYDLNTGNKLS